MQLGSKLAKLFFPSTYLPFTAKARIAPKVPVNFVATPLKIVVAPTLKRSTTIDPTTIAPPPPLPPVPPIPPLKVHRPPAPSVDLPHVEVQPERESTPNEHEPKSNELEADSEALIDRIITSYPCPKRGQTYSKKIFKGRVIGSGVGKGQEIGVAIDIIYRDLGKRFKFKSGKLFRINRYGELVLPATPATSAPGPVNEQSAITDVKAAGAVLDSPPIEKLGKSVAPTIETPVDKPAPAENQTSSSFNWPKKRTNHPITGMEILEDIHTFFNSPGELALVNKYLLVNGKFSSWKKTRRLIRNIPLIQRPRLELKLRLLQEYLKPEKLEKIGVNERKQRKLVRKQEVKLQREQKKREQEELWQARREEKQAKKLMAKVKVKAKAKAGGAPSKQAQPLEINTGEKLKEFLAFRSEMQAAMQPGGSSVTTAIIAAHKVAENKVWDNLNYTTIASTGFSNATRETNVEEEEDMQEEEEEEEEELARCDELYEKELREVDEYEKELEEIEEYEEELEEINEYEDAKGTSAFAGKADSENGAVRYHIPTVWKDLNYVSAPTVWDKLQYVTDKEATTSGTPTVHRHVHPGVHDLAAGVAKQVQEKFKFTPLPVRKGLPTVDEQASLLITNFEKQQSSKAEVEKACIFSASRFEGDVENSIPQFALLGNGYPLDRTHDYIAKDRRVFQNTNHPSSYFICGLQGSGKSHTTSCIIENHLLSSPLLGPLSVPCSALVFHYAQFTSRATFRPAECAFLAHPSRDHPSAPSAQPVNVLVSPSNFAGLNAAYSSIPGINVVPLRLPSHSLGISALLSLMSFDASSNPPLYIGQVTKVLREMAASSQGGLSYLDFRHNLSRLSLSPGQRGPLTQRLDLLESFIDLTGSSRTATTPFSFDPGSLTIIDLSCPFVDESTACILFNTILGLYLEAPRSAAGKLIAVDEAHKYLSTITPASKLLTEQLLAIIRQQRHYGARVVVSTQEPTVSPKLMDLSSATVVHRFSSPEWFEVLRKHVAETEGLFEKIVELRVGEAVVFAPSAIVELDGGEEVVVEKTEEEGGQKVKLGSKGIRIQVRKRITWDGGKSVVAVR